MQEKNNADIPICDTLSSKILVNQGVGLVNSDHIFKKYSKLNEEHINTTNKNKMRDFT